MKAIFFYQSHILGTDVQITSLSHLKIRKLNSRLISKTHINAALYPLIHHLKCAFIKTNLIAVQPLNLYVNLSCVNGAKWNVLRFYSPQIEEYILKKKKCESGKYHIMTTR